ncbi:hypothetical protein [Burkholderia sp. Ac-20365]|uniref:hypothetical protein n=1 Tax=Burkholderia sp. Ac-20365 TaxID=2703897 RepID=UPI00197C766A|nr:hypothetical protein [Burkholderia sp. Ac-20365]MBN3763228.1 hypothetical protein [Burkholderia sp. Ac-20365]
MQPDIQRSLWRRPPRRIVMGGAIALVLMIAIAFAWLGFQRLGASHRNDDFVEPMKTGLNGADSGLSSNAMPSGATGSAAMTGGGPAAGQYGNKVSAALVVARASLEQKNLTAAKAAVAEVLAVAPRNADALRMQTDIADRENERDAALRVATICAKDVLWSCVVKQANQALAADSGSKDAQVLLERAIVSNGWRPLSDTTSARAAAPARRPPPPQTQQRVAKNVAMLPTLPPLPPGIPADSATRQGADAGARRAQTAVDPYSAAPASADGGDAHALGVPGVQQ